MDTPRLSLCSPVTAGERPGERSLAKRNLSRARTCKSHKKDFVVDLNVPLARAHHPPATSRVPSSITPARTKPAHRYHTRARRRPPHTPQMVYADCPSLQDAIDITTPPAKHPRRVDSSPQLREGRKRPRCKNCGELMAGHKRPNNIPVCPVRQVDFPALEDPPLVDFPNFPSSPGAVDFPPSPGLEPIAGPSSLNSPLRREVAVPVLENMKSGQAYRYRNPNWEDPPMPPLPYVPRQRHADTPDSWVSTEPADDIPTMSHSRVKRERQLSTVQEDDIQFVMMRPPSVAPSSVGSTTSTTTRLRRSFTSILNNGVPILSMFSARREDVSKITQTARRNGLHTGVMRPPSPPIEIKDEDEFPPPKKPLWVIVGKDPVAVEHLLDLQERDELIRLDPTPIAVTPPAPPRVATTPLQVAQTDKPYQFSTWGLVALIFLTAVTVNVVSIFGLTLL